MIFTLGYNLCIYAHWKSKELRRGAVLLPWWDVSSDKGARLPATRTLLVQVGSEPHLPPEGGLVQVPPGRLHTPVATAPLGPDTCLIFFPVILKLFVL